MNALQVCLMVAYVFGCPVSVDATNITLISMTFPGDSEADFRQIDPVYDVLIRAIPRRQPDVDFTNFTHISLRCTGSLQTQVVGQFLRNARFVKRLHGDARTEVSVPEDAPASCFFRFFFANPGLFLKDLSQQFTLVTTT
ncbi:hypothetical protein BV898_09125, partial [Hypsibius exemplaris]